MSDEWLTPTTAKLRAEEKLHELAGKRKAAQKVVTVANTRFTEGARPTEEAKAVAQSRQAASALGRQPFIQSVGIVFRDAPDTKETWYISHSAEIGGNFAGSNVIPWTHWIGNVAIQLRQKIERREDIDHLSYGPEDRQCELPVGPLVEYEFADDDLRECRFHEVSTAVHEQATESLDPDVDFEAGEDAQTYGLKTIIRTIDLDQDDQIRGPMSGVFVLTGGPGVGKTTVALHRIPYLILEQNRTDSWDVRMDADAAPRFFTADSTLVVVWKEHLVPYLRTCVHELVSGFPDDNVRHIDTWVRGILRGYVTFGRGAWHLFDSEKPWLLDLKRGLDEHLLESFLASNHRIKHDAERAFRDRIPMTFSGALLQSLQNPKVKYALQNPLELPLRFASPPFSIGGWGNLRDQLIERLPNQKEMAEYFSESQQAELRNLRDGIRDGYKSLLKHLTQYADLLLDFYVSDVAFRHLRKTDAFDEELYRLAIEEQRTKRQLSTTDSYRLLWLIHLITEGSDLPKRAAPLPLYTHILVDEAQYYEPIVLRLFADLVKHPDREGVLTIVGDVEQRINVQGGMASWDALTMNLNEDQISRLETNYRWTREVFDFCKVFHDAVGMVVALNRPFKWRVRGGRQPEIHMFTDTDAEISGIVDRIIEIRKGDSSRWTIAVILPEAGIDEARLLLEAELKQSAIPVRWAEGEDVKESVDKVILTNYDSIVGLEFDSVFIIGVDRVLKSAEGDSGINALWVALTRAKRFICITRTGGDPFFDRPEFASYHCDE